MNIGWITDPHLDSFRDPESAWAGLIEAGYDAYVVTGDVADGPSTDGMISMFSRTDKPVYFVLGNHDCYGRSVSEARASASRSSGSAVYLTTSEPHRLSDSEVLTGVDGWYDCRNVSVGTSDVVLRDVLEIRDFDDCLDPVFRLALQTGGYLPPSAFRDARTSWVRICQIIADADAETAELQIQKAISMEGVRHIYFATHVPPFPKAAWHEGRNSDPSHLPYFSNLAVGKAIIRASAIFRAQGGQVTVLCGHTHSAGTIQPVSGIRCMTGRSDAYFRQLGFAGVIQIGRSVAER